LAKLATPSPLKKAEPTQRQGRTLAQAARASQD
jgi:hypothetical protein